MTTSTITKPGVYQLDAEVYHGNCTPTPALSAGFAWNMLKDGGCPAKAWFNSSLNPDYAPEDKKEFDIGKAAHLLFLEPDSFDVSVSVIDAADYRTKAAQNARDDARNAGRIPLLIHQAEMIAGMRRAMRNEIPDLPFSTAPKFADDAFSGGQAEQSYFWRDERFGIWCKCRPDYVKPGHVVDYKTSTTADPADLKRVAANMGWHVRAAHYLEGHKALTGENATYWYVVQEKDPPYLTTVGKVAGAALEWGRIMLPAARAVFAGCLRSNRWPSYSEDAVLVELPAWAERQLQDRHDAGEFDPSRYFDLARAWQAPL
ncbi:PD-(D/E)XK nuclease-like domain-containing protein [Azospirillum tabaci]|uniref:PD-(D/E)XK nuclease-like domain-containing protein n=1 Tax=Azospirillum tabaci TaxID=2752310 RepID=UPI0016606D9B|nr:PD-(D/E)XK nuclease-like domain-containing protein [Azospirillum tabaci]